ncbi:MAG: hypothetical protein WCL34_01725 [Methylococcaceae bacterium]
MKKLLKYVVLMLLVTGDSLAHAEWAFKADNAGYYTDDVALFSATRRLSLKDDPTQPNIDKTGQGSDFIYEPSLEAEWTGHNSFGEMSFAADAGGYVFTNQTAFTHGLFDFEAAQSFETNTKLSLHYNFVPDLFLGKNTFMQPTGEEVEHDEILTSHYWSFHVDQKLTHDVTFRLLSRYGLRNYNAPFVHRDTQFWTIGSHLEWEINEDVEFLIGYHYEKGSAEHHRAAHFPDDLSYTNHYASGELKVKLLEKLTANFIFDYEHNASMSHIEEDERFGANENIYQGEFELEYELTHSTELKLGWQHGNRRLSTEMANVKNNNVWLGFEYKF